MDKREGPCTQATSRGEKTEGESHCLFGWSCNSWCRYRVDYGTQLESQTSGVCFLALSCMSDTKQLIHTIPQNNIDPAKIADSHARSNC